jgi:PPM family protein phosphatase
MTFDPLSSSKSSGTHDASDSANSQGEAEPHNARHSRSHHSAQAPDEQFLPGQGETGEPELLLPAQDEPDAVVAPAEDTVDPIVAQADTTTATTTDAVPANGGAAVAERALSPEEFATTTEPLDTVIPSSGKITTPLPEAGGPPSPPLAEGSLLNDRYQVVVLLGVVRDTNIYRVSDQQGWRNCWACGSGNSMPGDIYCVECGAQLAGRYYRLQEFNLAPDEDPGPPSLNVAPVILANGIPGVAHVYDTWIDLENSRGYVAWEEVSGRTLASWLPGMSMFDSMMSSQSGHLAVPEEPEDEQALAWMVQSADLLARLHAESIAGCSLELANLLVQPGDRLVLLDPSGCEATDVLGEEARGAAEASDVRNLAAQLEQWYMVVRKDQSQHPEDSGVLDEAMIGAGAPMVPAYQVTGPLGSNANPALVLARAREGSYPTATALADVLRDLYEASKPLTNLKFWSGRASDVGRVRKINEDSVLTLEATVLEHEGNLPVGLYVVADGMGGHQSGEVASSIAARTIGAMVNSSLIGPLVSGDPVARDVNTCSQLLQHAVLEANRRINDLARERHSDLGTTVVAAILIGNQLTVVNVGDSRAYMIHEDALQVITRDHSLVMQLVAAGQIRIDDIYTHPRRNEIYRALGDPRLTEAEIDIFTQRLRPGDGLLLCSDGLWDFVRDPDIAAHLTADTDPQTIANALVDRANMQGGEDNISVINVRVLSSET